VSGWEPQSQKALVVTARWQKKDNSNKRSGAMEIALHRDMWENYGKSNRTQKILTGIVKNGILVQD